MAYLSNQKVIVYTSSDTWQKDARTKSVEVFGFNGGGGGGSGRKSASTTSGGGSGGPGGAGFYYKGPATSFGTSETVTIAGTAAGGVTQAGNDSNGNTGTLANTTMFGNMTGIAATAVAPAGTATTSAAVSGKVCVFLWGGSGIQAGASGGGSNVAGSTPTSIGSTTGCYICGAGGGGGAGYDTVVQRNGGQGGGMNKVEGGAAIVAAGASGREDTTINGGDGNLGVTFGCVMTGGSGGGGGGGPKVGMAVGKGGDGGIPAAGGGGGSGGINSTSNSGVGGIGARGQITVIEYF